jgi:hypothetical protein
MVNHPLPVGTRIQSLQGEQDGNGIAQPGSIGLIVAYCGDLGPKDHPHRQGHAYDVLFPITNRAAEPDDATATHVVVTIDQGDGLDDPTLYVIPPDKATAALQAIASHPENCTCTAFGWDGPGHAPACALGIAQAALKDP